MFKMKIIIQTTQMNLEIAKVIVLNNILKFYFVSNYVYTCWMSVCGYAHVSASASED